MDLEPLSDVFRRHCDLSADIVLEVGCGSGQELTKLMSEIFNSRITAIDSDPKTDFLNKTEKNENEKVPANFLIMDARKVFFRDQSFDLIVLYRSLHFIGDVPGFFRESRRVLREKSGKIIVVNRDLVGIKVPDSPTEVDDLLTQEFNLFQERTFKSELENYWDEKVRYNFLKYCDPERAEVVPIFPGNQTQSEIVESTVEMASILDLKALILKSHVAQEYLENHGEADFDGKFSELLENLAEILFMEKYEFYFEKVPLQVVYKFYVEIHSWMCFFL